MNTKHSASLVRAISHVSFCKEPDKLPDMHTASSDPLTFTTCHPETTAVPEMQLFELWALFATP